MTTTSGLVEVLKRELKSHGITYAQVARKLNLSEASVKRMFSRRDFTLKRLDQVCQLTQGEFSDLAHALAREEKLVSRLSLEQEKEIASSIKLFLVAVCVLNHVDPTRSSPSTRSRSPNASSCSSSSTGWASSGCCPTTV